MTTQDVIDKLYGVKTYQSNDPMNSTITAVPTQIVANDPAALQLTIINTGANDLMLWNDESVSTTKGILIAANGGSYEIDFTRFMKMPTYSWWGICAAGLTTTIAVLRESILG